MYTISMNFATFFWKLHGKKHLINGETKFDITKEFRKNTKKSVPNIFVPSNAFNTYLYYYLCFIPFSIWLHYVRWPLNACRLWPLMASYKCISSKLDVYGIFSFSSLIMTTLWKKEEWRPRKKTPNNWLPINWPNWLFWHVLALQVC